MGVTLPGRLEDVLGEKVGVVGRERTDEPKATVGVVDRELMTKERRLFAELVGVLRPDILVDDVLNRLERFKFPVEPEVKYSGQNKI